MKKLIFFICILLCFYSAVPSLSAFAQVNGISSIVYRSNKAKSKKIALTFDDGPHPRYTERILNILDKYNVRATFFVIGKNVENYPSVISLIKEKGHEIGNHSYSHTNESTMDKRKISEEMEKCEDLIYKETGLRPKVFRPPQGDFSDKVEGVALSKGYSIVLWSVDTRDWEHASPQSIFSRVDSETTGGDIILMHDYTSGKNTTCDALELIIPRLKAKGYSFVTVSELIG